MFTLHSFSFSTFEVCQHEKGISLFLLWWSYHQEHGHHFYHPNSLSVTIKLLPVLFLYPWHRFSNQCEVLKSLIFYLTFCKRGNETGSQASYWENPYGWSCCLSSWSFSLSQRFYSYVRYADRCSFVQKKKSFPFDNWTKMTISKMWCFMRSKGIAPLLFAKTRNKRRSLLRKRYTYDCRTWIRCQLSDGLHNFTPDTIYRTLEHHFNSPTKPAARIA